ncbi:orotate phosphoribosyltransferase [Candidatus Pacearchaeota archaeon]|nr:orotate phosphoribosyltransferase [Candidatus Pacearchaeota archaeon]
MEYSSRIAKAGLDIKAIKLNPENPFLWASGYRMPIYNDNRLFLSHPEHRELILQAFEQELFFEGFFHDQEQFIAGTSTAGIPWASILSDRRKKPLIYIRDKPKDHGLKNQIEGIDAEADLNNHRGYVIEDLISTGGSSAKAVQAVRNAKGNCNHCFSIFNYGLDKSIEEFDKLDPICKVKSLLTYENLLDIAKETKYINEDKIKALEEWRADPFGWGEKNGFPRVEKKQ